MKYTLSIFSFLIGVSATAQDKPVCALPACQPVANAVDFKALNETTMKEGPIYFRFTEKPDSFANWVKSAPAEYDFLSLWDGYKEPTMLVDNKTETEKLTVFVSSAKAILPARFDVENMAKKEFIRALDSELTHEAIAPNQIMPLIAGAKPFNAFAKCNSAGPKIVRPSKETNLTQLNRPGKNWCSDPSRSVCLESCFIFSGTLYPTGVTVYNNTLAKTELDKKDYGMATQSELRYFVSEAEMGKRQAISNLTGIKTPVRGVLEQNIFFVNQLLQYGKIVAIFQEHPTNSQKMIVTSYFAFTVPTKTWIKKQGVPPVKVPMGEVMMGEWPGTINTETGLTAGFPIYTRDLAMKMQKLLSAKK